MFGAARNVNCRSSPILFNSGKGGVCVFECLSVGHVNGIHILVASIILIYYLCALTYYMVHVNISKPQQRLQLNEIRV